MDSLSANTTVISEGELAQREAAIGRLARIGGVSVAAVTVAAMGMLVASSRADWWVYTLYGLMAGVPFAYAVFCSIVMRRMDMAVFSRYRSELMHKLTDLHELAYRDELTGLYNRRHFYEIIRTEVDKAMVSRQSLAIVLLDLDGLKKLNDEHGHGVGDIVLATLGKRIATHTRANDVPARLGGDEFGVVMPGTDKRGAFALARRLWADLEASPMYVDENTELSVTVSIGLAGYPWGGETVEEMLQWADADMYANKVSRKLVASGTMEVSVPADLEAASDDIFGSI